MSFCFNFNVESDSCDDKIKAKTMDDQEKILEASKKLIASVAKFEEIHVEEDFNIDPDAQWSVHEVDFCAPDSDETGRMTLQFIDKGNPGDAKGSFGMETDIVPNVYEGGLKVWECSLDLVNYLALNPELFEDKRVLELGCGAALPALFTLASGGAAGAHVQDYNSHVLRQVTIGTFLANLVFDEERNEEEYDDLEPEPIPEETFVAGSKPKNSDIDSSGIEGSSGNNASTTESSGDTETSSEKPNSAADAGVTSTEDGTGSTDTGTVAVDTGISSVDGGTSSETENKQKDDLKNNGESASVKPDDIDPFVKPKAIPIKRSTDHKDDATSPKKRKLEEIKSLKASSSSSSHPPVISCDDDSSGDSFHDGTAKDQAFVIGDSSDEDSNSDNEEQLLMKRSIREVKRKCRFFAGDWSNFLEELRNERCALKRHGYDLVLLSETLYNDKSYEVQHDLIDEALSDDGVALIASKTHYFGVGGGTRLFEEFLKNRQSNLKCETVFETSDGVKREILKLTRKAPEDSA